ncbi:MAG: NAD(P)/FAD-dependent oxidoreductase [Candidatus Latescibacterota bacterium]
MEKYFDIIIVGAGPAGLMAAIEAAHAGAGVLLLEAGPRPGRKLLATGGGRCNLSHDGTIESFLAGFERSASHFLKPAAYAFPPEEAVRFFESLGVPLKVERGARVFPKSDRAGDVLGALLKEAVSSGVILQTDSPVKSIAGSGSGFEAAASRGIYRTGAVILATGGLSMKRTGSSGDGYAFARKLGHTIVEPRPSLVPLVTRETWPGELAGLALKNVRLTAILGKKRIQRFGEMLFTHHGISGPITLEISRFLTDSLNSGEGPVVMEIDLKPALDEKKLDARLLREIQENPRRRLTAILHTLMPESLARIYTVHLGFDPELTAGHVTREERSRLLRLLKALPLTVTSTGSIEEALVTHGGISLPEIDSHTMESKLCPGLFFAGEIVNTDGDTGGYNLNQCWATGVLAGRAAANKRVHQG